jgi:hypothetical protein
MKVEIMLFSGEAVGLQITAEGELEHQLLESLSGLKATKCRKFSKLGRPGSLHLVPSLPWKNTEEGVPALLDV